MWRQACAAGARRAFHTSVRRQQQSTPIIHIDNATFFRRYPTINDTRETNPSLFAGLSFSFPSHGAGQAENWSVISPSSIARTTFLQILTGQHICIPPQARTYPYLHEISQSPQHAVKYVGFDAERGSGVGGTNVRGAYLSARYESRREETDFSLLDYLTGHTELNALERDNSELDKHMLDEVTQRLNLRSLLQMPVANLSNGQTRRARIAKALMARPEVLLLDGPFMGLDPNTLQTMSEVLRQLAERKQPRLIMSLRPEDGVPNWVDHLVIVDEMLQVLGQGAKDELMKDVSERATTIQRILKTAAPGSNATEKAQVSCDGIKAHPPALPIGAALVDMRGVKVSYGDKTVLGDWEQTVDGEAKPGLWWSLRRGQRCGIFGPNGSGKTTMLSLITSDHPQTYSLPITLFGRSRLPRPGEPGISVFDIQRRMGHSSPEVHAFFPKRLTARRTLESAWADAPLSKPVLSAQAKQKVDACLRWFARDLHPSYQEPTALEILEAAARSRSPISKDTVGLKVVYEEATSEDLDLAWADDVTFGELSFSNQRLMLFLRAIISSPDLVILDEALSGIDESTRDKALLFLSHGETISTVEHNSAHESPLSRIGNVSMQGLTPEQALLVISHSKEDVPGCLREWICLPEPGEGRAPRIGALQGPLQLHPEGWNDIWGR